MFFRCSYGRAPSVGPQEPHAVVTPTLPLVCSLLFAAILMLPLHLSLLPLAAAQISSNISRGSSLTLLGQTTSLVSPNGDFALGFRPLDSDESSYLLSIWFVRVPNQTVVWAANRNQPVQMGSKFMLGSDGNLNLTDAKGAVVWSSGTGATNVTHAAMLDSGNFVLVRRGSADYEWESFQDPMDIILPSQVLPPGRRLTSRFSESNYANGRFQIRVQATNLTFYQMPPSCPIGVDCAPYDDYWTTGTVQGQNFTFSENGDVFFGSKNGSDISIIKGGNYSPREFYMRATLDPDGVLRMYTYKKNSTGGSWSPVASVPSDICVTRRFYVGSGVCGYNSYCTPDGTTQKLNCSCPPQYSFVDPARQYKGCKPDFAPQSCDEDGGRGPSGSNGFVMKWLPGLDWPSTDYEHLNPVTQENCSNACLNDCFCSAVIHRNFDCWMKRLPLMNGRYDMADLSTGTALIKLPGDPSGGSQNTRTNTIWLILLGSGNGLLLAIVLLLTFRFYHMSAETTWPSPESSTLGTNLLLFTYKQLQEATQGFREELGKGAYSIVYKGLIESGNTSTPIAVKRLQNFNGVVIEKEFENELRVIAEIHHKNLVTLIGYCNDGPHRLLVYEYMSRGSLSDQLLGSSKPDWDTRVQLALGVARGLLYLHEDCSTQIIHCDVKPQNVLIDDNFNARISDFGLSKLLLADQSRTLTGIRGTRGYVAPEWFKNLPVTSKVDVYSFGVLLLEIICCRRSLEAEAEDSKVVLTHWVYDCYRERRLDVLVEDETGPLADVERLERLVMVALWCIQEEPSLRPTMKKVLPMLEGTLDVPALPDMYVDLPKINQAKNI